MRLPLPIYRKALEVAVMLQASGLSQRDALRKAGADLGVGYGADADKFIKWADAQLKRKGDHDGQEGQGGTQA